MPSLAASLSARIEQQAGRLLVRLPDGVVRRIAGDPITIDDRTLEPRIQLAAAAAAKKPPIHTVDVARARVGANASLAEGNGEREPGVRVDESTTPGGLPIRVYRAGEALTAGQHRAPAMLFMHQGGFVVGDLDSCDSFCARVAATLGVIVVSLDYRLAPEHKFPAQIEDAASTWAWLQSSGAELGIDTSRIIVAGDSAGGHLAALLSQRLRDAGGALPLGQLLVYPFVDGLAEGGSMDSCAASYPLSRDTMSWFGEQYLSDDIDVSSALFSPAQGDLTALPPAIVVTAGFDPLRDQGIAYAAALDDAGVATIGRCEDVLSHSFLSMDGMIPEARAAHDRVVDDLRALLAGDMTGTIQSAG